MINDLYIKARAIIDDLDARVLLKHVLGVDDAGLLSIWHDEFSQEIESKFMNFVDLRSKNMPIAHIIGKREFMSCEFYVSPDVLIPRPETETLVNAVIERVPPCRALDIGTGSGNVAIMLALAGFAVDSVDISQKATEIAKKNANLNNVKVNFHTYDIFKKTPKNRYDIIISNPPYIETAEIPSLDPAVRDYEPHTALDGGTDGLKFYNRIMELDIKTVAVEVGHKQAKDVANIMKQSGFTPDIVNDLAGIQRVVFGHKTVI